MKKWILILTVFMASLGFINPHVTEAYNFGDFRSETLIGKAWGALNEGDIEAVLAYTNKTLELYADQAKKMQNSLDAPAGGSKEKVFSYWALNDVATGLFIQGEAYRRKKMFDEAKTAFQKLIDEYSFGQTWDNGGWFWQPAEAAKEKLEMIASGSTLEFGDYSSSYITSQAWRALRDGDTESVLAYTKKVFDLYAEKADAMQESLTEYPWESKDKIFSYWALNDVGTSYYIRAEALRKDGKIEEAKETYQTLVDNYFYAQCWDPQGWFWKPSEAAQEALDDLDI